MIYAENCSTRNWGSLCSNLSRILRLMDFSSIWAPILECWNKSFTIGQTPVNWSNFSKICIKIIQNVTSIEKIEQKYKDFPGDFYSSCASSQEIIQFSIERLKGSGWEAEASSSKIFWEVIEVELQNFNHFKKFLTSFVSRFSQKYRKNCNFYPPDASKCLTSFPTCSFCYLKFSPKSAGPFQWPNEILYYLCLDG